MYAAVLILAASLLGPVLATPMPTGQSPAAAAPDVLASPERRSEQHAVFDFYDPSTSNSNTTSAAAERRDLSKRDQCWGTDRGLFNAVDARNMQNDLQRNDPNLTLTVKAGGGWVSASWGTALVCIQNNYLFENTAVTHWEIGWVVGYIIDMCCAGSGW